MTFKGKINLRKRENRKPSLYEESSILGVIETVHQWYRKPSLYEESSILGVIETVHQW